MADREDLIRRLEIARFKQGFERETGFDITHQNILKLYEKFLINYGLAGVFYSLVKKYNQFSVLMILLKE